MCIASFCQAAHWNDAQLNLDKLHRGAEEFVFKNKMIVKHIILSANGISLW